MIFAIVSQSSQNKDFRHDENSKLQAHTLPDARPGQRLVGSSERWDCDWRITASGEAKPTATGSDGLHSMGVR